MSDSLGLYSAFVGEGWFLMMVGMVTLGASSEFERALMMRFSEGAVRDWSCSWATVDEVDPRLARG